MIASEPTTKPNGKPHCAATNRENARNSTGPRTNTGKKRSSMNALRHGLTGQTIVLPSEDLAAYHRHTQSFFDEYQPKCATEKQLVQELADTAWRLNRVNAIETNLLALGMAEQAENVNTAHPQAHDALAMASAFRAHAREFTNLGMYGQRLSRQFQKTLDQLREIRAHRLEKTEEELTRAAKLLQMHNELDDAPYNPSEDGFVFSTPEIETFIRRHDRGKQATQAAYRRAGLG